MAELPGYTRGLSFHGPYAAVGLSQMSEKHIFGGLPITARAQELKCGVWAIDLRTGRADQFIEFEAGIEELFAVEVLAGVRFPESSASRTR